MRATKTINRRAKLVDWLDPFKKTVCPKVSHATRAEAHAHMKRLTNAEGRLNVYRCHVCRAWHVGNLGERMD